MPANPATIKVALVEDDLQVRQALAGILEHCQAFTVVGAHGSAEEALRHLPAHQPDVVLMDIQLPGLSGIQCLGELKRLCPRTQFLMLTVFEDHERILQSLSAGASGYLVKSTAPEKIVEAIRELHRGGSPMSAPIARRIVEIFQRPPAAQASAALLSPRENEIIHLLAKGYLYKEIAARVGISIETVRTHLHHIYEKLHVRTRTEAVMKVFGGNNGTEA